MKKIILFAVAVAAMSTLSGCSDDMKESFEGEGRIMLRPELNSDVVVKSRAAGEEELANSCLIWISSSKGLVRKYEGINAVPAEGIWLVGGHYTAEAWAGDSVPASFESRYFKGAEGFDIKAGQTLQVNLQCKIANVVASVKYGESIDEVLKDYTLTIGHKCGELTFEGRDVRKGYFMMPSIDKNLTWTLSGSTLTGEPFTRTGVIENVEPATEYSLNVKYESSSTDVGGGYFSIVIDETTVDVSNNVVICAAPDIKGVNFDINDGIMGEVGNMGDHSAVYITAATALKEVVLSCDQFASLLGISGNDFELIGMTDNVRNSVESKGISNFYIYDEEADISNMKIIFDKEFLNALEEGEYTIGITATDKNNKSTSATLKIVASNAMVVADEVAADAPSTWADEFTLTGTVMQDNVENVGFNLRKLGTQQWEYIPAELIASRAALKGQKFTARITGVEPGTTYEYVSVCDGFVSTDIHRVTTEAALQLPNAGFEEWDTSGKVYLLYAPGGQMFWDSGNHGSATMNKNITTPDSDIKHSGNYSARLASQFVGIGSIGKFAAGNVFIGQYLGTDGTDGILGWGRPFTSRPKALKGYVKYTPATVTYGCNYLEKGATDMGIIYIAIVDGSMTDANSSKVDASTTSTWPVIIKTKTTELFSKDDANVIAYGEQVFTAATAGDGMIEFNIPLEYFRTDVKAVNIVLTCSASRYGDYFAGGPSVMYIDDLELVY